MKLRPRIAVAAYACEPEKGSEPGAGWALATMIGEFADTWLFTRANNVESVERAAAELDAHVRPTVVAVEPPAWARSIKRGAIGLRVYYVLWLISFVRAARAAHRRVGFDAVWHATFANAYIGSLAPLVGPPFIYGPVGGGVPMPWNLAGALGGRGLLYELARATARGIARLANPLARYAWSRAQVILVQNDETLRWLPARHRRRATVFQNAIVEVSRSPSGERAPRTALFAGRLVPWKGVALAIRCLEHAEEWTLEVAGEGRDRARLQRIARRRGVQNRVRFLGALPREELRERMAAADALLFPSLHEDAGFAVAEAIAAGTPVVALAVGGPRATATCAVPVHGTPRAVAARLADALRRTSQIGTVDAGAVDRAARGTVLRDLVTPALEAARRADVAPNAAEAA